MTDRAKVESILREMYAARARGDVDALMHHCDEGMQFCISGCSSASPVPLAVEGGSSVREAVTSLVAHFTFSEPDLRALVVEGDRAAAHWRVRVRPATGATRSRPNSWIWSNSAARGS
jgi:ketosteroid isomerase-like protein